MTMKFFDNPRGWSNGEIRKAIEPLSDVVSVVNVSGFNDEDKEGGRYRDFFASGIDYFLTYYPSDKVKGKSSATCTGSFPVDLMEPLPQELIGRFDLALNHTVLEHVPNPFTGFEQIAKMSRDLVMTVVPFRQSLHFHPGHFGDYFRLSPMAMRYLHEINGFTTLYESVMPPPSASTVYLVSLATKQPEKHADYPRHVPELEPMNHVISRQAAKDSIAHVVHAVRRKAMRLVSGDR